MADGFISDVDGDETVMDHPTTRVCMNIADLPPAQALALDQQAGESDLTNQQRGALLNGEQIDAEYVDVRFHLPIGPALTALAAINAIDIPQDAPDTPDEIVDQQG
jgi:hypothetical protein